MIIFERRRHRDNEGVGRLRLERCAKLACGHGRLNHHVEVRFNDVNLAGVDGIDDLSRDVYADPFKPSAGKSTCQRQSDITQSKNRDALVLPLLKGIQKSAI